MSKLEGRTTAKGLTAVGAEAWCLQQMSMDISGVSGSEPLWARLDIRAQDAKENSAQLGKEKITDSATSVSPALPARMIEMFQPAGAASAAALGTF